MASRGESVAKRVSQSSAVKSSSCQMNVTVAPSVVSGLFLLQCLVEYIGSMPQADSAQYSGGSMTFPVLSPAVDRLFTYHSNRAPTHALGWFSFVGVLTSVKPRPRFTHRTKVSSSNIVYAKATSLHKSNVVDHKVSTIRSTAGLPT